MTFHFKISSLATLELQEVLKEHKEKKQLRGSGEIAKKKKDWMKENEGPMKRLVEVSEYKNLKLGD